ncbi:MAG TPA: group III truncated hemoglobin [Cryomorphaceae bacterium]|nr:group III truncated hemoglobin [Cryomorphaceae bacterium]
MKTIDDREDVSLLVNTFYAKIRRDDMLGDIFNRHVDDWPAHLSLLTDFWESNLFRVPKFRGNPPEAHRRVDHHENNSITPEHFGRWMKLWYETVDELFVGERAEMAKALARRMSTGLFLAIWHGRPQNQKAG